MPRPGDIRVRDRGRDRPHGSIIVTQDDDIPALVAMLVVSLISWLVVLIAYIVALVVCWARALQLYIMAAFAPSRSRSWRSTTHADRDRISEELHGGVHCRAHHTRFAHIVSDHLGRAVSANARHRGTPHRRHRRRAHLRAPIPGNVHPAHPLSCEERHLGARYSERFLAMGARWHTGATGIRP